MLVTGGTGGLGGGGHRRLRRRGLAGGRTRSGSRPGTEPAAAGRSGSSPTCADPARRARAVEAAAAEPAAPLRAVVNLVGGYAGGGLVHETPVEEFERMLPLNLRPTYLVTRRALPHLVAAGGGAVVCVSARAAVAPFAGAAGYATAKAAVLAFANAVAVEYRQRGVRCNTVLPSVIDTPANRAAQPDADHSRWVPPAEIAEVIRFLAGDESAPTSGASHPGLRPGLNRPPASVRARRHRRAARAAPTGPAASRAGGAGRDRRHGSSGSQSRRCARIRAGHLLRRAVGVDHHEARRTPAAPGRRRRRRSASPCSRGRCRAARSAGTPRPGRRRAGTSRRGAGKSR